MATFTLRPQQGGRDIAIPPGKTTIGRGPFLGVSDKRVSRSHAVLELTDEKLTILPLHINPTFYKATEKEKFVSLKKDETKDLNSGNVISLLPDSLCFEVICEGSLCKNGMEKEQAETSRKATDNILSAADNPVANDLEMPLSSSKVPTESFLDEFLDNRPSSLTTHQAAWTDLNITDKEPPKDETTNSISSVSKQDTSSPSKPVVEPAPLLQKTRKLPSWLTQSKNDKSPAKKVGNNKQGKTSASGTEKKTAASNKGGQTAKKSTLPAKRKPKTAESDEDFIVSDDEEEKHLKKTQKTKNTSKKRTSNSIDSSDEDITPAANKKAKRKSREIQSDSEDEYEPVRPEKSKPVKPVSGDVSSGSDEEEVKPPSKKRVEGKTSEKDKSKTSKLPSCSYGSKCYRKNPAHFKEYSHPSKDDDDEEGGEAAAADSDDDRPECPYGTSCYRRNPQHKRDFKHTETPGRPKRKKASKHGSVLDDASDDDGPNTYDYNDSFLADDGEESGSSYSASDDSDWQPQGDDDDDADVDEDVNELLTEARGFLRSKNMTRPV